MPPVHRSGVESALLRTESEGRVSLIDAIPQSIRAVGAAKSNRAAAGGAYGQLLGQLGRAVGQIPALNRQRQSEAMRNEILAMQQEKQRRETAAEEAINRAMSSAIDPATGSVDRMKLAQNLVDTPAAAKLPAILEQFDAMDQTALRLQGAKIDVAEAEDDVLGSIAHAASQLDTPDDRAGILAAGVAAALNQGTLRKESANAALAAVLGADGNPDPAKVDEAVKAFTAKSGKQRALQASDAQKKAAQEAQASLSEEREAKTVETRRQTALKNFSSQLSRTGTNRDLYGRIYANIPAEYRDYFDSPDEWSEESAEHAVEALMTPGDRVRVRAEERQQRAAEAQAERDRRRLENDEERLGLERRRVADQETRTRNAAAKEANGGKTEYDVYKDWSAQYERARDEERQRAPEVPNTDENTKWTKPFIKQMPDYQPPPSFQKWQAMTPAERAQVMTSPAARISDSEMNRRMGQGGSSSVNQPVSPAPTSAKPAASTRQEDAPAGAPKIGAIVTVGGRSVEVTGYRNGKIVGRAVPSGTTAKAAK